MKILLQDGQNQLEVEAEWIAGRLWYHWRGETRVLEPERRQTSKGSGEGRSDISAPMPGRITRLLKNPGDSVAVGDLVVVMEAMKMEYSLKAEVNGEIMAISCAPGDQVSLGQVLAKIQPAEKTE